MDDLKARLFCTFSTTVVGKIRITVMSRLTRYCIRFLTFPAKIKIGHYLDWCKSPHIAPVRETYGVFILRGLKEATLRWRLQSIPAFCTEIINLVATGAHQPYRPELPKESTEDLDPQMLDIARACWRERPSERPDLAHISKQIKAVNKGRSES